MLVAASIVLPLHAKLLFCAVRAGCNHKVAVMHACVRVCDTYAPAGAPGEFSRRGVRVRACSECKIGWAGRVDGGAVLAGWWRALVLQRPAGDSAGGRTRTRQGRCGRMLARLCEGAPAAQLIASLRHDVRRRHVCAPFYCALAAHDRKPTLPVSKQAALLQLFP